MDMKHFSIRKTIDTEISGYFEGNNNSSCEDVSATIVHIHLTILNNNRIMIARSLSFSYARLIIRQ